MAQTLRMPLTLAANGALAVVLQGSDADIAQSVALLLATIPGERRSVPDYGLPNPLGDGVDVDELIEVISEWEDRADPTYVEEIAHDVVQQLRVIPNATGPLADAPTPRPPIVVGPRYSTGLGIDADGRPYIDPASDERTTALKVDDTGRPYLDTTPEPQALTVGVDDRDDPYFERS